MKKLILLLVACGSLTIPFKSYALLTPAKYNQQQMLAYCVANQLSVKQYQTLTGRKLSISEKINYFLLKHHLKKNQQNNNGFNAGGFILGFLSGPIGVGIAYLVSKNKRFRKGAVTGFVALVGLGIIGAITLVTIVAKF